MRRSRPSEGRQAGSGAHGFIRVLGGGFWGFGAKARLADSNLKELGWVNSTEALIKACTNRKPWEVGRLLIAEVIGEVI